jgi:NADP-dependent 3-hydroxy acid dehydrogenase YdfG
MPRFEPHPARRAAAVTGASSGIGAATALALAAAGHPVALGARRAGKCEELAAAIRAGGGEAVALPLDVTDDDSVKAFAVAAADQLGPVEVLVSCAGEVEAGLVHELDPAEFARQVEVNLIGAHRVASVVMPAMVARRRGDVVFVSSDVVRAPRPRMGAYVAAKNAVDGMARAMQMELEGTGVRVSVVRPGQTMTGMGMDWDAAAVQAVLDDWVRWGLARHPHFLRPEDVAAAVMAIVSTPRGAHITLLEIEPEAPIEAAAPPGGTS